MMDDDLQKAIDEGNKKFARAFQNMANSKTYNRYHNEDDYDDNTIVLCNWHYENSPDKNTLTKVDSAFEDEECVGCKEV